MPTGRSVTCPSLVPTGALNLSSHPWSSSRASPRCSHRPQCTGIAIYGVLAPNAPLRAAAITALAPETAAAQPSPPVETIGEEPAETPHRSPARYLWAMLLARRYARSPPTCRHCGTEMPIVAFITEKAPVQQILNHIGEPSMPPRIAPARGPPPWEGNEAGALFRDEEKFPGDLLAPREPEHEFDQRMTC
jgi:hypothetical protein